MSPKYKKIALILAGGTVLSEKDQSSVNRPEEMVGWLSKMPELSLIADIEPVFLLVENHDLTGPELWHKINDKIFELYHEFDGFILTGRTSEILYTSLSSALALVNLNKPIVYTGSQLSAPVEFSIKNKKKSLSGLGIKANLINAVQVATMDLPAVGLMFGNVLVRPGKAQRTAVYSLNIFNSLDNKYLAKIDFGISPQEKIPKQEKVLNFQNHFSSDFISYKYFPGQNDMEITAFNQQKVKGLFIDALAEQPVSGQFLVELKKINLPVVIYNKFLSSALFDANILYVGQVSKESAMVKFSWALGRTQNQEEINKIMTTEYCSEFLEIKK